MSSAVSPDARGIWRAVRAPLATVGIIVAASLLLVLLRGGDPGALDPRSAEEGGSRALATLLERQGVRVERVTTAARAGELLTGDASLLVTEPDLVRPERLRSLGTRSRRLVLVGAHGEAVSTVAPALTVSGEADAEPRRPGCAHPDAVAAGTVTLGGVSYRGSGTAEPCYGEGESGALAERGRVALLGGPTPLTNAALDEEGNAALAMRLLGRHERLVWYLPTPGDPALRPAEESVYDLAPPGVLFGLGQVAVAVVLLALWRARRLGPVVTEPLPVVVRGAETVEGTGRLYRKAGAAGHAADVLRGAALRRLRPALGLAVDAEPRAVSVAVASRSGRAEAEVSALLYGPPPSGDAELVRLADALDTVESEVMNA
ncbi:DUF4350 domain-containing protein [Amycolatopsis cihanbeyliensis]|uniref:Uncharacterized protein DUF4350 n=1 Tax=Amycolatopsis cihanbeyliensis TaxID=1128664 RepID=A0A542DPD0_AMYCI|nr:DUF4350 domain-containing protein [Amycolatopsis cihanbeyliensis]TQJ04917.1 uncharacterized protein DUF4350 [Amycolatopsis cihanbeyliensis]